MTTITLASTPGTIKATTLGNFIWQLASWGLQQQRNINKNPNQLDYLTISTDPEFSWDAYPSANGGKATIEISFPCVVADLPLSDTENTVVPDYLTNSGFDKGSGGTPTFSSTSWCQQLWQACLFMATLQINPAKNSSNLTVVTSATVNVVTSLNSVAANSVNGALALSLDLPLIQVFDDTTGNVVTSGASPMGSLS